MRSLFFILFVSLLLSLLLAQPAFAIHGEKGLVPCGNPDQSPCQICHIPILIKNIIEYLTFHIVPPLAALLFIAAGIVMLTSGGNPKQYELAKSIFKNTVIGLLIVYTAWLIIAELLFILADRKISGRPWNELPACTSEGGRRAGACWQGAYYDESGIRRPDLDYLCQSPGPGTSIPSGASLSEQQARQLLASNAISVNKDSCPAGTPYTSVPGGCTTLAGVRQTTIDRIVSLKNASNCPVTITGGTEKGHGDNGAFSHEAGAKVDIGNNACISNFITSRYKFSHTRKDGSKVYIDSTDGTNFADEQNHWDIAVTNLTAGKIPSQPLSGGISYVSSSKVAIENASEVGFPIDAFGFLPNSDGTTSILPPSTTDPKAFVYSAAVGATLGSIKDNQSGQEIPIGPSSINFVPNTETGGNIILGSENDPFDTGDAIISRQLPNTSNVVPVKTTPVAFENVPEFSQGNRNVLLQSTEEARNKFVSPTANITILSGDSLKSVYIDQYKTGYSTSIDIEGFHVRTTGNQGEIFIDGNEALKMTPENRRELFIHEIAHNEFYKLGKGRQIQYIELWAKTKVMDETSTKGSPSTFVSDYAKKNFSEFWAESVASYVKWNSDVNAYLNSRKNENLTNEQKLAITENFNFIKSTKIIK